MSTVALEAVLPLDFFEAVERKFSDLLTLLQTRKTQVMKLSDLEKMIETEGREVLRLLLQAHVDSRGDGSIGQSVEGSDGTIRTHRRIGKRQIKSIFGTIELKRMGYGKETVESLFPKDGHLNLPKTSYSHELQRRVAAEVLRGSFDDAVEAVCESTGVAIPKQQVEHITVCAAADFEAFYEQNPSPENLVEANTAPLLILTTDGKGIVMHKEDLRELTREKAKRQEKHRTRLSPGEKRNSKRMATVASVYGIEPFFRKPDDFRKELASIKVVEEIPRPRPLAKRVWASVEKTQEEVVQEIFDEGVRRDPKLQKTWVALVDGDPRQIDRIESEAKARGISVTVVCDIIHVIEYLWKAAWSLFKKTDRKTAEKWVNERFIAILEGKSSTVAAGIRRAATNRKLGKTKRKPVDTCVDYLLNKGRYLKYHQYLEKGFPIATGVIEGACRHLIKDRMDLTGARWRLQSAEAVFRLRSLKSSGDFADYWIFHEKQEFMRNHQSKYKRPSVLNKLHLKSV